MAAVCSGCPPRCPRRYPPVPKYPPIAFYSAIRLGDPEQLAKIMDTDPYFITQDNGAGAPVHFATTYKQLDMVSGAPCAQRRASPALSPYSHSKRQHLSPCIQIPHFFL